MTISLPKLGAWAKLLTALAGAAAEAVSQGLLTGSAAHYVAIAVALATALGVYVVPNAGANVAKVFDPSTGNVLTVAPKGAPAQAGPGVSAVVTSAASPPVPEVPA